jgi:hypothetical protein
LLVSDLVLFTVNVGNTWSRYSKLIPRTLPGKTVVNSRVLTLCGCLSTNTIIAVAGNEKTSKLNIVC